MSESSTNNLPLSVVARLTHCIGRAAHLPDVYEAALDALEAGLDVRRSSILLFDPDGIMRFKAWRGISEAYRRAVEGHTPWTPKTVGAECIVVPNVEKDGSLAPYLATFRTEQIAALTFVPLEGTSGVIGKFMLYHDEPHTMTSDQLDLAELIAAQITFTVERTRSLEIAQASEEQLRFALDAASMGTWDWDLRTEAVTWSENMERIHGLPSGTFDGTFERYEREIHPDDREHVHASIRGALTNGTPHDVEYRIIAPDGSVRWVEGKGRVEYDEQGRAARMSGVCMNISRRKQAELARIDTLGDAHRIAQRLAAIVESSDDAIVSKDLNGIIESWNRGAERMFGYSASEAVGQSILLIVPPDRHSEEDHVLSSIRAGRSVEMETVRRSKSGASIDISLKVSPVKNAEGGIAGVSKIARDISQRKRVEAERAELHRRLTLLVEASASLLGSPEAESVRSATMSLARQLLVADGYALWTNDSREPGWRIVKSEGISAAFTGRVITSYQGAPAPLTPPFEGPLPIADVAIHPMVEEQREAYRDEGVRSMLACPMRFGPERSGTLAFYFRTPHVFSDVEIQSGQALANLATAALTTAELYGEQRWQREAAESARRHAAFLADATQVLSQSLDYELTLAAVAQLAVPEIADWCAVDVVDEAGGLKRLAVAHIDPTKVEYARMLEQQYPATPNARGGVHDVIRTGMPAMMAAIPADLVADSARDDAHKRTLQELTLTSYMCVPLGSPNAVIGAITFVMAESGRHYSDRDLLFAQDVAARATMAIDNALAYRRAHDANRLKDEFLAMLSHELRTPLNAILGYAQMLSMNVLKGDRRSNALSVLTRNAEGLSQMIDDVLDVSRITSGKLRLQVAPIHLDSILTNAIATIQPAADAKGIALQPVIDTEASSVSGDADRLQQVVWNLLSNAVKFTPRGGHVQVRLERIDAAVQIVVSDDGTGIEPAFLPHVFERFRQADSRFSRQYGGLGLGLAIVRDIVHLHGGSVSVSSEGPGTGATFTVRLPALTMPLPAPTTQATGVALSDQALDDLPKQLTGVRILAVDDEEDALGLLRAILESADATVTTATSGRHALDLLQTAPYDVLIADIGMPEMDGLELIRTIRRSLPPPANHVLAAALTAYARSEDRVAALADGFQHHIAKPVHPVELVTMVTTLLDSRPPLSS